MSPRLRYAAVSTFMLCALCTTPALAQWGMPGGWGDMGWMGFGVGTAEGDILRGSGMFLMGAGEYNKKTAEADSINTDTMMRWNEYVHEAQMETNRRRARRIGQDRDRVTKNRDAIQDRLRNNPEPRDIQRGDALNTALDEIDDPRVYVKALQAAKIKIGGETIRNIPFRYAAGAITFSIHDLVSGHMPEALRAPEFAAEREVFTSLEQKLFEQSADDIEPDAESIKKLLAAVYAAEEKVAANLPRNTRQRNEAERFLRALHGLAAMLRSPSIDVFLAGVDKRPDATLGELLNFMAAFNLRFGVANTPQQRDIYRTLYPLLVQVRDQVAPALATTTPIKVTGEESEKVFDAVSFDDLQKKTPKP